MQIPTTLVELLEAHLEPKEAAKALQAIGELLSGIESKQREHELQFVDELKTWLSTELATKSELVGLGGRLRDELARLEGRLKEELVGLKERMAAVEGHLEATAAKDDLARLDKKLTVDLARLDKKLTVYFLTLLFAVIFLNQAALEFVARLFGLVR